MTHPVPLFRSFGLRIGTSDGGSRDITDEEWATPLYFSASREKPDPSWGINGSDFPFYGFTLSLYIGTHVGWIIDGKKYPREAFQEHRFDGTFTGGAPIGLTPLITLQ